MTEAIKAYPLTWPATFPRSARRDRNPFKSSLATALNNVHTSLRRFASDSNRALKSIIISSNVTLGANTPADAGVAVWFEWDGLQVCIPVDRYATVEANLQAIHHIIEARRVELRHGTLALVRATFTAFAALPSPESWWQVLGLKGPDVTAADIDHVYKRLASKNHPDNGGDTEQMARINRARDQGLQDVMR